MSRAPSVTEATESARGRRRMFWAQVVAVMAGICFTIPAEVAKVRTASETKVGLLAWIFLTNLDTTFPLLLFRDSSPGVVCPQQTAGRCRNSAGEAYRGFATR